MTNTSVHKTRGPSPAAETSTNRADDLLGAVVPLRVRDVPATSEQNDLSNVIPFHPRHRAAENDNDTKPAPPVVCNHSTRPCPFLSAFDWRKQWPLLLVGSVAAHASLFAWFMQEPPPKSSIGLEVIAVEMVLGAQSEAGTANTPGQTSVESGYRPDLGQPDDKETQLTEKPIVEAKEEPKEVHEDPKPVAQEDPKPQFMAAAPPEPQSQPELAVDPEPKKEPVVEAVKEKAKPVAKKPVKETGKAKKQRIAAASPESVAANSVGRGRSDADANYKGMVVAHLTRHQGYLKEAVRGDDQGLAVVKFGLDGSGRVTSVQLVRSSGFPNLDREVQNMVRRASPFPPHPHGKSDNYSAPINFSRR
jgi:protein TonB